MNLNELRSRIECWEDLRTESIFYDETPVLRASVEDVDFTSFARFIERYYSQRPEDFPTGYHGLLRNLRLAQEVADELYPTVACLFFFGREPQRFLSHAHLVAARIPGRDLAAPPADLKRIEGVLPAMFEDAARFLNIHLPTRHRIQGFQPEMFPELPEVALCETLVNALAHRDYTVPGPIRVLIDEVLMVGQQEQRHEYPSSSHTVSRQQTESRVGDSTLLPANVRDTLRAICRLGGNDNCCVHEWVWRALPH